MKTVINEALSFLHSDTPFILATVIRTWGSAPRKAGSHMLITKEKMIGSVSGGCVENDVFREANTLLLSGANKLLHYGVSDDDAWQVGLSCGGEIDVLLEVFHPENSSDVEYWNTIARAIERNSGAVAFHGLSENASMKKVLLPADFTNDGAEIAKECYIQRAHRTQEIQGVSYFIEVIAPKHQLLIIGAAHMTMELVTLAKQFDFETTVIDPRGFFIDTQGHHDKPDQVHQAWPAEILPAIALTPYTYAVTLSHDPKIDDQALEILLRSEVAYIGALGSKKTHAKRVARLQAAGFSESELARIHAPVGIDIHAQSAKEIALSILADLICEKNKYVG